MYWFQGLVQVLENIIRTGGIWFIFIIALLEALPLIGAVIPGHTLIILSGFLSYLGVLNLSQVLVVVSVGAIFGDYFGYLIGRKYGMLFLYKYGKYFLISQRHIERAKEIIGVHTGKALILGRFNPVMRALIPFFVGVSKTSIKKFWIINIISGTIWAVTSVMLGYIAGAGYQYIAGYIGHLLFWGIIYAGLIVWAYVFLEKREYFFHRKHLYTLVLSISALVLFSKLLNDAFSNETNLGVVDVSFNLFMRYASTPFFEQVAKFFSLIFNTEFVILYSLIILGYLIYKKRSLFAYFYVFTLGGGFVMGQIFKNLVQRIRPEDALVMADGFSFPSGHTLSAVLFLGSLAYFTYRSNYSFNLKTIIYGLLFVLTFFVGASRLYLMVHWLTDVIGGASLGIFWFCFALLLFHVLGKQAERWALNSNLKHYTLAGL